MYKFAGRVLNGEGFFRFRKSSFARTQRAALGPPARIYRPSCYRRVRRGYESDKYKSHNLREKVAPSAPAAPRPTRDTRHAHGGPRSHAPLGLYCVFSVYPGL